MRDLRIKVVSVEGVCTQPMRVGDYFEVRGGALTLPEGGHICIYALSALLPLIPAKERNIVEQDDWMSRTWRAMCPDPNGRVVFEFEEIGGGGADDRGTDGK